MKTQHIRNISIIIVISILITLIFDYAIGGIHSSFRAIIMNVLYGIIIGVSISFSGFFAKLILKQSNINKKPSQTFIILLISISIYITVDVFLVNAIWYKITQGGDFLRVFTHTGMLITSLITILIGLVIFLIILSNKYIIHLLKAEKETQKAKDEASKFQYETLKNQINPHFLFNSLNVLSTLIYKDAEKADEFTLDLANIYRFILDHQDDEIVTLEDEIDFVNRYAKLQGIRFNQNFSVEIKAGSDTMMKGVVPMALQLVIENVFKHNVITDENPMLVKLEITEGHVLISNPIHLKQKPDHSHKLGLQNIKKRYQLLTDKPCSFEKQNGSFVVKLPLIDIKQ